TSPAKSLVFSSSYSPWRSTKLSIVPLRDFMQYYSSYLNGEVQIFRFEESRVWGVRSEETIVQTFVLI
ncbi:MAG: hypothetical protein ACK51U_01990, partial [bacterium]